MKNNKPFSINGVEMKPQTFAFTEVELAVLKGAVEGYVAEVRKNKDWSAARKTAALEAARALAVKFGMTWMTTPYTADDADRDLTDSLA